MEERRLSRGAGYLFDRLQRVAANVDLRIAEILQKAPSVLARCDADVGIVFVQRIKDIVLPLDGIFVDRRL